MFMGACACSMWPCKTKMVLTWLQITSCMQLGSHVYLAGGASVALIRWLHLCSVGGLHGELLGIDGWLSAGNS